MFPVQHDLRTRSVLITEEAYRLLRGLILTGEMPPGRRLLEGQIAQELNISRTPLREAVRKLEQEGFVQRLVKGGVVVTLLSAVEVKELYSVRAFLEELAVREATRAVDSKGLAKIQEIVKSTREWRFSPTVDRVLEHGWEFHTEVCRASGNGYLLKLLQETWDRIERYRRLTKNSRLSLAVDEHEAIAVLMAQGDAMSAGRAAQRHVENEAEFVLNELRNVDGLGER
ncbi:MAG TPA: GntR family transcriptional regulator [Bacillota bacterium]|nr:GntR family transcriptional regulator [Bacillota bacterium]